MSKRILIFRHNEDCPPGNTTKFFNSIKFPYDIHFWPESSENLDLSAYSGMVVLGGPQNVDQEDKYPWLRTEKQLIKEYLAMNRPILGICLGGQLLAELLGADVRRHEHTEAGWHQIHINPEVSPHIPQGKKSMEFFQWHEYRFLTPKSAQRFAENHVTADQGFVYRDNVIAVQFHPESDREWIETCSLDPEYPKGKHVVPPEQLLTDENRIVQMNKWYFELLENLFVKP